MLSKEYAAGFFDGEGCVSCSVSRTGKPFIRILIVNTNLKSLETFQKTWGGDISKNYRPKAHWKQAYTWRIAHSKAIAFLKEILPFLIIKKEQAELAIALSATHPGKGNKWEDEYLKTAAELVAKIKHANKKGVDVLTLQ